MKKFSKNIKTVIEILQNEVNGDTKSAFRKMTDDYTMTWVYNKKSGMFPRAKVDKKADLSEVYKIEGRKYEIMNIAESKNLVIIEMIESYPDPKTKKVYRTPEVVVLEFKGNKIKTGRHYTDPDLSFMYLTKRQTNKAYVDPKPIMVIE